MRLFCFKEAPITHPASLQAGVERERWTFDVNWLSLGFHREVFFKGWGWSGSGGYYSVGLTGHFGLGYESTWYEGPHNSFSLGFLHFCWS